MSGWIIASWVFVAILTAGNVVFFLKLKKAAEQMMKAAFPGAKNMNEMVAKAQQLSQAMQAKGFRGDDAQMKRAMEMMGQVQMGKGPMANRGPQPRR